jgi:opacity protein-like surface antigen
VEVVLDHEKKPVDCMTYRFGIWLPRDREMSFAEVQSIPTNETVIDQSQAFGLDMHFRKATNNLLSLNMSVGAWYTTYSFSTKNILANPSLIQDASNWAVIVPLTIGASLELIPDNMIMPYAMAGVGVYAGISGKKVTYQARKEDDTKVQFAFGGFLGAGVDIYLTPSFGLSAGLKYQLLEYKEYLWTYQRIFNGIQLTAGIATKI